MSTPSTPTPPTVVITGASRGIGLALARLYLARGARVFAVCRQVSPALQSLPLNIVSGIDVSDDAGLTVLQEALAGVSIDLLINNAGILRSESLGHLDKQQIRQQLEVNALAPLMVTEALLHHLASNAKVALITSRMGSIADNSSGGRYGYRMSKAALNMAGVSLSHDLRPRGIAVAILHPGLVATDMIGGHGDITPTEAAARLAQRIDALTLATSGTFWHANGEVLPW
jgi:NAD(P)-dependent dehydrogenase (short-subunit alcohol dehydrogenase family)